MGLFATALEKTTKDNIKCAIANLKLFLADNDVGNSYLLDLAQGQIETAKEILKQEDSSAT